ncbi:hypothetical protein MUB15_20585 [Priestia sp. OVS21]|nr:hypothetical protein [Priestia sp. OVS21]
MAYYPREERETLLLFDEMQLQFKFRSTSPKHIERLMEIGEVTKAYTDDDGLIIDVEGYLSPAQVRFYATTSEKQSDHMAKMRSRRLND